MLLRISLLAFAALACAPGVARAAESFDGCTGFITALPATISTPGTWCLKKDLATALTTGRAINVASSFVTIDCNGFKIGNLDGGTGTAMIGVYSRNTIHVGVRHCNLRGFVTAIDLGGGTSGGAFRVEGNLVQSARNIGIRVEGNDSIIRGNTVSDTGGSTLVADSPKAILTTKSADIENNTVSTVAGQQSVYGLHVSSNNGGSIRGNLVRDLTVLTPGPGLTTTGIYVTSSERLVLRNNEVFNGATGTVGIRCPGAKVRARDNIVRNFTTGTQLCGDAGGNDVTP